MKATFVMRIAPLMLSALALPHVFGGQSTVESYVKSLKGKQVVLRAHPDLFRSRTALLDPRRIYEADISEDSGSVRIGHNKDWQGNYYVSAMPCVVKDVSFQADKNLVQVKLWAVKGPNEPKTAFADEFRLSFQNTGLTVESFSRLFFAVFFGPNESVERYTGENDKRLITAYLDVFPEVLPLSDEEKRKILSTIRFIGLSGKPQLEKSSEGFYIPADLAGDGNVYNDVRVSKNQRIASSIEGLLPRIKGEALWLDNIPSVIHGLHFSWSVMHRDFLNEDSSNDTSHPHSERVELLVSAESVRKLASGTLSAVEMLQESILRVDGTKTTLTSYEPTGGR